MSKLEKAVVRIAACRRQAGDRRPQHASIRARRTKRASSRKLEQDGDVMLQVVALMDEQIIGHILFYPIGVRGKLGAARSGADVRRPVDAARGHRHGPGERRADHDEG